MAGYATSTYGSTPWGTSVFNGVLKEANPPGPALQLPLLSRSVWPYEPSPPAGSGPVLTASYFVSSGGANSNTLTTPSFTPSNGEVIVVKATTWDTTVTMSTPTGGSQTYTSRIVAAPGGFHGYAAIWTAVISGSPGSMTVSSTPSASSFHAMTVERWSSAQLAASPAVNSVVTGSNFTPPQANITTAAVNSVLSWCISDSQSASPTGRTYLLSATEDGLLDGSSGSNSVQYHAYASVTTATTYTVGMSTPSNQIWVLAGIEVQAAAGGGGSTVAPNGVAVPAVSGTPAVVQTFTAAPSGVAVGAVPGTPTVALAPVAPGGVAVPTVAGAPTVAQAMTVSPGGVAVQVAAGPPTVAQTMTVSPTGVAVAATTGTPVVGAAVVGPNGISLPTAVGTPTVAQAFTVSPAGIAVPRAIGTPSVGAGSVTPNGRAVPVAAGTPTVAWAGSVAPAGIAVPIAPGSPTAFVPGSVIHRPNTGTVPRPAAGTIVRPDTGTVARPAAGIIVRPNTGVVGRP